MCGTCSCVASHVRGPYCSPSSSGSPSTQVSSLNSCACSAAEGAMCLHATGTAYQRKPHNLFELRDACEAAGVLHLFATMINQPSLGR